MEIENFKALSAIKRAEKSCGVPIVSTTMQLRTDSAATHESSKILAGPTGFEPATSCVTGRRSNQTELRPRMQNQRYCEKPLFMGLLQVSHTSDCLHRSH